MPSNNPLLPQLPQPKRVFDPFNSSSTGHQRAENRLAGNSTWRNSRAHKLGHQLRDSSGRGGSQHLSDLVGAGNENFGVDGIKDNGDWVKGAPGTGEDGWRDIREVMKTNGQMRRRGDEEAGLTDENRGNIKLQRKSNDCPLEYWQGKPSTDKTQISTSECNPRLKIKSEDAAGPPLDGAEQSAGPSRSSNSARPPQIFAHLTIYLNGSTMPLISDHKLKRLLAQHGASISLRLSRRTITHVILGEKGGGGLAAAKLQKEIVTVGGKGVKFVNAQWVLDSIAQGKRQSEDRYKVTHLAMKGQRNASELFQKSENGRKGRTPNS